MSVLASYIAVIIIWSTTPMAIKLGVSSVSPHAALLMRVTIALLVAMGFIALCKRESMVKPHNWKLYAAAGLSLFPNMSIVYMAAEYIPSALIAIMFALTPLTTGLLASVILREKFFNMQKLLALVFAISGLVVIFNEQLRLNANAFQGIGLMLLSNLVFSSSQVAVKYYQPLHQVGAFEQTLGALCFSVPGLLVLWLLFDGVAPDNVSNVTLGSIVYLAIIGSLLGFVAYFIVLSSYSMTAVSTIPLITPALALWLGALVLHEPAGLYLQIGTAMIVSGLALYDGFLQRLLKRFVV